MRAMIIRRHGHPDVLEPAELPTLQSACPPSPAVPSANHARTVFDQLCLTEDEPQFSTRKHAASARFITRTRHRQPDLVAGPASEDTP